MEENKKSNKTLTKVVATVAAVAIILTGTWAWRDLGQNARNEFNANPLEYDVELIDIYTPERDWQPGQQVNKDVYGTNTGTGNIWVRIQLEEFFDLIDNDPYITPDGVAFFRQYFTWQTGNIKSVNDWQGLDDAWYFDADTGWFYWGNVLASGESTGLLLDSVTLNNDVEFEEVIEYIIDVYLHGFSANGSGWTDFEETAAGRQNTITDVDRQTDRPIGEDLIEGTAKYAMIRELCGYVEINDQLFPDPVFRQYVMDNFDIVDEDGIAGQDGWLNKEELGQINAIDIRNTPALNNVIGIEKFKNLEELIIIGCELDTAPDISANESLRILDVSANRLTTGVNISKNSNLEVYIITGNLLTEVPSIKDNTSIRKFLVHSNPITSSGNLDFRDNTSLEMLSLYNFNNRNTPINTSDIRLDGLTNLKVLYFTNTSLNGSMDLRGLQSLEVVHFMGSNVTSINITGLNNLTDIRCIGQVIQ